MSLGLNLHHTKISDKIFADLRRVGILSPIRIFTQSFQCRSAKLDYYHLKMAFLWLSHGPHLTYAENSFLSLYSYICLLNSIFPKKKTWAVHITLQEPAAFNCKRRAQGMKLSRSEHSRCET